MMDRFSCGELIDLGMGELFARGISQKDLVLIAGLPLQREWQQDPGSGKWRTGSLENGLIEVVPRRVGVTVAWSWRPLFVPPVVSDARPSTACFEDSFCHGDLVWSCGSRWPAVFPDVPSGMRAAEFVSVRREFTRLPFLWTDSSTGGYCSELSF
jgi:hypothetical protein